jgi:hypothetical protein
MSHKIRQHQRKKENSASQINCHKGIKETLIKKIKKISKTFVKTQFWAKLIMFQFLFSHPKTVTKICQSNFYFSEILF